MSLIHYIRTILKVLHNLDLIWKDKKSFLESLLKEEISYPCVTFPSTNIFNVSVVPVDEIRIRYFPVSSGKALSTREICDG